MTGVYKLQGHLRQGVGDMNELTLPFVIPTPYQRVVGVILGCVLILVTAHLIQQFRLKEEHGWPWFVAGFVLLAFCLFLPVLKGFTWLLGAVTPVTALFSAAIFFLVLHGLLQACILSRQKRQIEQLARELALQEQQLQWQAQRLADQKHFLEELQTLYSERVAVEERVSSVM